MPIYFFLFFLVGIIFFYFFLVGINFFFLSGSIFFSSRVLTLYDVAGHERGRVIITLEQPHGEIPLDLESEEVSRVLLLDLRRVGRVELDTEAEEGLVPDQADLVVHLLVQVEPELE